MVATSRLTRLLRHFLQKRPKKNWDLFQKNLAISSGSSLLPSHSKRRHVKTHHDPRHSERDDTCHGERDETYHNDGERNDTYHSERHHVVGSLLKQSPMFEGLFCKKRPRY